MGKMIELNDFVKKYLNDNGTLDEVNLPLCHTTDLLTLKYYILPSKKLKAIKKTKYHDGEKLLFFFLGKAPYRPSKKQKDSYAVANHPITLLYGYRRMEMFEMKRLICFDSGAHHKKEYYHKGEPIPPLEIFTIDKPKKQDVWGTLFCLYKTVENYLKNQINLVYSHKTYHLSACLETLNRFKEDKENSKADWGPQAYTIEIQYEDKEILLRPCAITIPLINYTSELEPENHWYKVFKDVIPITYDVGEKVGDAYKSMREKIVEFSFDNLENNHI